MPSLTTCLKKAGDYLNANDKSAIIARARALKNEGVENAHQQAVKERIEFVAQIVKGGKEIIPKPVNPVNRLRSAAYDKNPLLTFLATHGLFHDATKKGSLKAEFSPDKQLSVSGYGFVFRKTGKQLDALTERAIEDGYLPKDGTERELYDLIRRAVAGEKITPKYAEGVAESEGAARLAEHMDKEDPYEALDRFGVEDSDIEGTGFKEASPEVQKEIADLAAQLEAMGIDTEAIRERAAMQEGDYHAAVQSALKDAIARSNENLGENTGEQGKAGAGETLTSPTVEDVLAQQERQANAHEYDAKAQIDREVEHFKLTGEVQDNRSDTTRELFQASKAQTETPAFKEWFGDSKVVDAEGKPLVLWRGEQSGERPETYPISKTNENGIFLTADKKAADGYDKHGDARPFYVRGDKVLDLTQDTIENRKWVAKWAKSFDEWIDRQSGEEVDPFDEVQGGRLFDYEGNWSSERWKDLQAAAKDDGFNVLIAMDTLDGMAAPSYIALDGMEQLKAAVGNNGNFDPKDPRILFQGPTFYSALKNEVGNINAKAQTGEAWASNIQGLIKAGKVKADEVEWTGLLDYLKLTEGKVTKEQVQQFLDQNGVRVTETHLGDMPDAEAAGRAMAESQGHVWENLSQADQRRYTRVANGNRVNQDLAGATRNTRWTLPGGTNQREIVLSVPGIEPYAEHDQTHYGDIEGGRAIAWVRANDRIDADGKKVFFIEEIQSKRAQDGKQHGFDNEAIFQKLLAERDAAPDDSPRQEEIQRQIDAMGTKGKGVPSAPFVDKTDKWLTLALKKIIVMAAREGYDKVAFVNGEQSAERYDLSKQISRVTYTKAGILRAYDKSDSMVLNKKLDSDNQLEDYVGKDVAKKLIEQDYSDKSFGSINGIPAKELSGMDLKVGGEGMKAFYDKIVPNTLKDVLRKVGGGQIETTPILNDRNGWHITPPSGTVSGRWMVKSSDYNSKGLHFDTEAEAKAALAEKQKFSTQPAFQITPAMREKAEGGLPLFQEHRGSIKFSDGKTIISLFEKADPSTLIHESGHAWLEELVVDAQHENAPQQIKDDLATVRKVLGNDGGEFTVDQHEQFARAFEAYLFEGKAPSKGLARAFASFKTWLMNIYKTIDELHSPINDELRQVFDRMLATDEEIEQAKHDTGLAPNFKSKEEAGMTTAEWKAYLSAIEKSKVQAESTLLEKMMGKIRKQRTQEYKDERNKAVEDAAKVIDERPDIQALNLTRGTAENPGMKLDAAEVAKSAPLIEMPRGTFAEGGVHPDIVAEMVGMDSGDALIKSLQALEKQEREIRLKEGERRGIRKYLIDQAADEKMTPDTMDEASMKDEAIVSIHSEQTAELLALELHYLKRSAAKELEAKGKGRRDVAQVRTEEDWKAAEKDLLTQIDKAKDQNKIDELKQKLADLKAEQKDLRESVAVTKEMLAGMREHVDAILENKTTAEIGRFETYLRDERKAARLVQQAILKKDPAAAAAAKQRQMLSHILYTRAKWAADELEKDAKKYARMAKSENKTIAPEFRAQIENLLERFGLKEPDGRERPTLKAWVDSMTEQGKEPDLPDSVFADAKPFKSLSLREARDLRDAIDTLEKMGRNEDRMLTSLKEQAYDDVVVAMVDGINANARGRTASLESSNTNLGKVKEGLAGFAASHVKTAIMARVMDGDKEGPVWEYLIRPANHAADFKTVMNEKATKALSEILSPVLHNMGGKGKFFETINKSLNREAIFKIVLDLGNESNKQRLLDGYHWTMDQLKPVIGSLTKEDLLAIQKIWDHIETYRPLIAAKEMRVYGKEPVWIERAPFDIELNDGTVVHMKGGYIPAKYDPRASVRAESLTAAEAAKRAKAEAFISSTTRHSFTKPRSKEVHDRPLLLSLDVIFDGVSEVIHDLAWHEWVIDANKLMRSKRISDAMRSQYGFDVHKGFKSWINDIAAGDTKAMAANEKAMAYMRQNVSISLLALNTMSALVQPFGITQSISRIGAKWVGKGLMKTIGAPLETADEIYAMSDFMRTRPLTGMREMNEVRSKVKGQTKARAWMEAAAYFMMTRAQQMVDLPTWWGAYEKALFEKNDQASAIDIANQAVKDSQGSGGVMDQSAIERGGEGVKLLTALYSFQNTALNMGVLKTMTHESKAKLAVDYLMLYTVPVILVAAMRDALTPGDSGTWDDPEKMQKKLAAEELNYLFGLFFGAREFAGAVQAAFGVAQYSTDYQGPTGLKLITDATKLGKQIGQGEFDDAFRKAAINVAGELLRLPAAQLNRTITGFNALKEGSTDNPMALLMGYQEPH